MKKRFLVMAMAGLALAGCVSEDVSDVKQKDEKVKIAFESPILYNNDNESRANVFGEIGDIKYGSSTYTYPREESFQIYAIQHTGEFAGWEADNVGKTDGDTNGGPVGFNNTSISWDENIDGWVPLKDGGGYYYWPASTLKMSFAACSPAELDVDGVTITYGSNGLTIQNFEIAGDASKQYDLLFSKRSLNMTSANMNHAAGAYSGIPIQFQHALSSIRFSLLNKSSEELVLKKITVYGTKYKGDFSEGIDETKNKGYYTDGENKNVTPAWEPTDATIDEDEAYIAFEGSVLFPTGNAQYVMDLAAEDTDGEGETDVCNMLLLLPQTLTESIKVHVEYTVNGHPATKTVGVIHAEKTTDNSTITAWEIGTRYAYRLYYSAESADKDKIYFAPSTDVWKEAGAFVIELL